MTLALLGTVGRTAAWHPGTATAAEATRRRLSFNAKVFDEAVVRESRSALASGWEGPKGQRVLGAGGTATGPDYYGGNLNGTCVRIH